jgi:hypothetical protein
VSILGFRARAQLAHVAQAEARGVNLALNHKARGERSHGVTDGNAARKGGALLPGPPMLSNAAVLVNAGERLDQLGNFFFGKARSATGRSAA